jgi:hypothetical protein
LRARGQQSEKQDGPDAYETRDLSAKHYVYFWADGIRVQARLEDAAQCLLVIIGATPGGKKELVGLIDGVRESAQSWKDLLLDLERRGLGVAPKLAVADGALGFWQAIEEVWPQSRGQRCWVHKTANVLNKLPIFAILMRVFASSITANRSQRRSERGSTCRITCNAIDDGKRVGGDECAKPLDDATVVVKMRRFDQDKLKTSWPTAPWPPVMILSCAGQ